MFDRQGIPEDLIRNNGNVLQFEDVLAPLISYSLIRIKIEKEFFDMY
jgi:hypothetical protein